MEYMHELKEMLCEELEKIVSEGELTAGSLETVDKLTHSIKSIGKIIEMEEDGGYSTEGTYRGSYRSSRRGNSMRNYRGSRNGGSYVGNYGGSYRNSRGEESEMLVERIEDMMAEVEDPKAKKALEKAIKAMEM